MKWKKTIKKNKIGEKKKQEEYPTVIDKIKDHGLYFICLEEGVQGMKYKKFLANEKIKVAISNHLT